MSKPAFKTRGKRLILAKKPPCKKWRPSDDLTVADNLRLTDIPDELLCNAFSFLDVPSLGALGGACRRFRDVSSRNAAGWSDLCRRLWSDKVRVPSHIRQNPDARAAYRLSKQDAETRSHVTLDELLYCPETHEGTIWSFRFKESAGSSWTALDAWHQYLPCRKMVFLPDGTVKQYTTVPKATPTGVESELSVSDPRNQDVGPSAASNRHESDTARPQSNIEMEPRLSNPRFLDDVEVDNGGDRATDRLSNERSSNPMHDDVVLVEPPMTMTWRFVKQPIDLPERPTGSYIRFTVGGRDVPTYVVRRSPTENWGRILESCWGVFADFSLPKKRNPNSRPNRPRMRRRLRRTQNGGTIAVEESDEDDDDTLDRSGENSWDDDSYNPLSDDRWFSITSGVQWREAFLYNFGARVLPEGNSAAADFERTYGLGGSRLGELQI